MKVLSLFSGVGGFDMGLEAAGMTTVFQCEIDKNCLQTLNHHWPDVPKWDDVSTLTGRHILEMTGGVDVVAWGSPCQDLSIAGKRAGLTGERSGLFHHGIRIIKELRELSNGKYPTWSIWENVVGALSSNGGADFGEVLFEMDEAGACFSEWAVLDAQHFGVPQRRRRVFVISCFDSATADRCGDKVLAVAQSSGGNTEKSKSSRKDFADQTSAGVGDAGQAFLVRNREEKPGGGKGPLVSENSSLTLQVANDQVLFVDSPKVVGSLNARDYKGVGNQYVNENKLVVDEVAIPIQGTIIGRQDHNGPQGKGFGQPGDPMFTLDRVSQHGVKHEMQVRRLTPLECTRLMGWRDDHLEIGTLDAPDQDYARQVVRYLWRGLQQEAIQRHTRGFWEFLTPEILLSAVRLGWISWDMAGRCASSAREVQSENAWPESFMRLLWSYAQHRQTPYRREPFEQLAKELDRPLPFLSSEVSPQTQGMFYLWVYEQAQGTGLLQQAFDSMEKMGRSFVYQEKVKPLADSTRYKMCGNGVASPVARWIGEQIMKVNEDE